MSSVPRIVAYTRSQPEALMPQAPIVAKRAPTANDINYPLGTIWINTVTAFSYILTKVANNTATWAQATTAAGDIDSVTGNAGGAVLPVAGNVNLVGDTTTITSSGAGATLTFSLVASPIVTGTLTAAALTVTPGPISLTGTTNINIAGAANTAIGTGANTGTLVLGNVGNGATVLTGSTTGVDSAPGGGVSIGSITLTTGDILIGQSQTSGGISIGGNGASTGVILIAPGTGNQTIEIANDAAGIKNIQIGNGLGGNDITIGSGNNTVAQVVDISNGDSAADSVVNVLSGAPSAGNQTVNILSGIATGGTQTLNLGGAASAKTINIGTGAAVANTIKIGGTGANAITIGNTQTAGSIALGGAMTTGTITLGASTSGLVAVPPVAPAPVASPGATIVINARVGYAAFTGFTTAAAAKQVFTITNSLVTAASAILVSASNLGANDAQMTVTRVVPGVGTFDVTLTNNGSAALNGDVYITFWVIR